jgi:hypothetical protein
LKGRTVETENFEINTSVVRALIALRGIETRTLANLLGEPEGTLLQWLAGDEEAGLEPDAQMELLRLIGFPGGTPKKDVVHYWRVQEPLFSRPQAAYWALSSVLEAFGPASMTFVARESEPFLSLSSKFFFALTFGSFHALVEVKTHPLRGASLRPERFKGLTWTPEVMAVVLENQKYDALQPGAIKVPQLRGCLEYPVESRQWEHLRVMAQSRGLSAQQLADILSSTPVLPAPSGQEQPEAHKEGGVGGEPPATSAPRLRLHIAAGAPQ